MALRRVNKIPTMGFLFAIGSSIAMIEWAIGAVASAAVLHTVGRGFESLIAHHFLFPRPPKQSHW